MPVGSAKKSVNELQKTKRRKSSSRSKSRGVGNRASQAMTSEEIDPPSKSIYPKLEEENSNNAENFENLEGTDFQRSIISTQTDLVPPEQWYASRAFVLSVLVLAIALFMAYGRLTIDSPEQPALSRKDFGRVLAKVAKAYPAISDRDISQLRGAANRWFDSSSNDPVVVVIYTSDQSTKILDDFVNETASFLDQKTTTVVHGNVNIERAQLYDILDNTLRGGTKSTIGVRNLEKLKFDAALMLQGFADGDLSVPSRPLFWLQVTRDSGTTETSCDAAIERTLINSWTSSGGIRGDVAPIISRILQFTPMMRSMQQILLLALAGQLSCEITIMEGISWISCQMYEYCDEPYIKPDFKNMTKELERRVFGQHIVERIVVPALQAHFERQHSKPLVMSFNGMTGVGKNHVAKIIAENIYKKGLDSSHVHHINSIMDFSVRRRMHEYQIDLQDKIFDSVSDCGRSMFIFDEVDKLPEQLLDTLKPFLEYNTKMKGVDFRNAIFIFLSNHGDAAISTIAYAQRTQKRIAIKEKDLERKVIEEIYNSEGGLKMSELIKKQLIDHFVPFLPLRREHVRECILVYLKEHYVMAAKDDKLVDKIVDELIYFPENEPIFSSSGCKRVEQKATVALAEWRNEAYRKTSQDHDEI